MSGVTGGQQLNNRENILNSGNDGGPQIPMDVIPSDLHAGSAANTPQHPGMVPPSVFEQQARIFSGARFLHLYLSPGCLGATASPEFCHQNPEVTRGCIILHPGTDYTLLIKRIHHIVKSVNPPAWGISDIPPHTWTGWGVKLFIPMNGPRILKELWETVGEQIFHLEVRLVPPAQDIDENWFCVTAEQHMALQNYRGDAEVDLYARFKEVDP